ncbi:transposase [Novosphingobium colocasiae]
MSSSTTCPPTKSQASANASKNAGMHLLYLPPYSPDFNPIEQVFSKIKGLLRQMNPRSFDAICDALKVILQSFKPGEYAKIHPPFRLCANLIKYESRASRLKPESAGIPLRGNCD